VAVIKYKENLYGSTGPSISSGDWERKKNKKKNKFLWRKQNKKISRLKWQ
jgi:hypothetical protein